jgi:hypothetical protein
MPAEGDETAHQAGKRDDDTKENAQAPLQKKVTIRLGIDACLGLTSDRQDSPAQAWAPIFGAGFAMLAFPQRSTTATPLILIDQPIELGINAATLMSLQNLKIGR